MRQDNDSDDVSAPKASRRIVVRDSPLPPASRKSQGRKLEEPPEKSTPRLPAHVRKVKLPRLQIRKAYVWLGLSGAVVLVVLLIGMFAIPQKSRRGTTLAPPTPTEDIGNSTVTNSPVVASAQSEESDRIEEGAKQVLRQISRDNKPYSFSEHAIEDIRLKVLDHRQTASLSRTLATLQGNSGAISARAAKEGLQPSLVILVALALTKGGESGDCVAEATRAMPLLASLNKTFGSNEADSSLLLIAALHEGTGTRRSHPLLRRMNRVVTNPLAERNIWFLHDQNVLSDEAYNLVVDTIAYGVIARNPRQFGLENDPLSL